MSLSRKIDRDHQRLRAGNFHRLCCLFQIDAIRRDQDQRREIACKGGWRLPSRCPGWRPSR